MDKLKEIIRKKVKRNDLLLIKVVLLLMLASGETYATPAAFAFSKTNSKGHLKIFIIIN
jgi:hypothetical protein